MHLHCHKQIWSNYERRKDRRSIGIRGQELLPFLRSQEKADATQQPTTELWSFGAGNHGECPWGFTFAVPATAKENSVLQDMMQLAAHDSAWLPLQGLVFHPTPIRM